MSPEYSSVVVYLNKYLSSERDLSIYEYINILVKKIARTFSGLDSVAVLMSGTITVINLKR